MMKMRVDEKCSSPPKFATMRIKKALPPRQRETEVLRTIVIEKDPVYVCVCVCVCVYGVESECVEGRWEVEEMEGDYVS